MGIIGYYRLFKLRRRHEGCSIHSTSIHSSVKLGHNVSISAGVSLGPDVQIGNHSYVNSHTEIKAGEIGRFCSIGPLCSIGLDSHPVNWISTSPLLYQLVNLDLYIEPAPPPHIGNDVWIGAQSVIMRGVNVGDGSVVAAGAVVTKDVAPYSIVGGVPSRLIRYRFDKSTIYKLLKIRWWQNTDAKILSKYAIAKEHFTEEL